MLLYKYESHTTHYYLTYYVPCINAYINISVEHYFLIL